MQACCSQPACTGGAVGPRSAAPAWGVPAARSGPHRRGGLPLQAALRDGGGSSGSDGGSGGGASGGGGGGGGGPKRQRARKPKQPGVFEVRLLTPPPRSLGVYELPPLTHNGEEVIIDGEGYVVQRLVLRYKLRGGKYHRDHNALEVTPTGRWITEQMLENLMQARYVGPTGPQD
ncbi:hypothetical protein Rsub_12487 [Raphidocelis subcapitata]|uniref:Uncharacterized protein n=1 Tax=Raphidocelis subcapitata TaxID=307507 RepID=A0A2V0PIP7_9CHLO|nr:hypothetical protein Rsub_12487 [Raphidocelis subcapitata]|eukprot:GBF99668.1 hypothetical protein Rsub_12487 [Raphidocelis subcapitata]